MENLDAEKEVAEFSQDSLLAPGDKNANGLLK